MDFTQPETVFLGMIISIAVAGLIYAVILSRQTLKHPTGTKEMNKISSAIRIGANSYLKKQLTSILAALVLLTLLLFFTAAPPPLYPLDYPSVQIGRTLAFLMGAGFSASVGYIGMNIATRANVRVTAAADRSFGDALRIAYRGGTVTGMLTDGLGLLGGTLVFIFYREFAYQALLGFGFGGTLIALFYRVGGGIYTKAADVGADLVGKVEKNIPEDDPRNAAVIADLVGDNVGDCAGMAADIFESYEVTEVAAMILGLLAFPPATYGFKGVLFPLMVRSIGVLSSIIGTYAVRLRGEKGSAMRAIFRGYSLAAITSIAGFIALSFLYMQGLSDESGLPIAWWKFPIAIGAGIGLAVATNRLTEYFTSTDRAPVKGMARACQTGAATNILAGIAVGYESSVWAILTVGAAILVSVVIFGSLGVVAFYGVALCGIGQLTLTGNNVAMDSFGPISDNANGIAEMAKVEPLSDKGRQVLADLDAVGNTTKAVTKAIAIGSAVIAAVSLFKSYTTDVPREVIPPQPTLSLDLAMPLVFIGLLIGGAIPFLFSSIAVRAVGRAASQMVGEVRRQFAEIKGLWEGKAEPDYARCVRISTSAAQKELLVLGVLAIASPLLVGFLLSGVALGGFLAGAIIASQLLAVFMATAGGAWDNAKKSIEDGLFGGKGSEPHKASVIGDTVGDPLKDTAGPALNPMMKVINLISIIMGSLILQNSLISSNLNVITFNPSILIVIVVVLLIAAIAFGLWYSKRETEVIGEEKKEGNKKTKLQKTNSRK